ncbi:hypothetical protein D3C75_931090 [compost metagenome]
MEIVRVILRRCPVFGKRNELLAAGKTALMAVIQHKAILNSSPVKARELGKPAIMITGNILLLHLHMLHRIYCKLIDMRILGYRFPVERINSQQCDRLNIVFFRFDADMQCLQIIGVRQRPFRFMNKGS